MFDFLVKHFAIEEEDGAESLILCGGGDVLFASKMDEEGLDFGGAHVLGWRLSWKRMKRLAQSM